MYALNQAVQFLCHRTLNSNLADVGFDSVDNFLESTLSLTTASSVTLAIVFMHAAMIEKGGQQWQLGWHVARAEDSDFRVDSVSKPNEKVGGGLQTNAIRAEMPMTPTERLLDFVDDDMGQADSVDVDVPMSDIVNVIVNDVFHLRRRRWNTHKCARCGNRQSATQGSRQCQKEGVILPASLAVCTSSFPQF